MRFKYSILYLILSIMIIVGCGTLLIGYYLNLDTLRTTLEEREASRAYEIYNWVNTDIKHSIRDISALAQILKQDPNLLNGLRQYQLQGEIKPLQKTMNNLYITLPQMDVEFFMVTDQRGKIVYQVSTQFHGDDASWVWGMEEALAGRGSLSAGLSPLGWTILTLTPISQGSKQYGVLIMGIPLNDAFARKIAEATRTQISFSSAYQILASSWPAEKERYVDLSG